MEAIIDPGEEVTETAWRDFCRRNKLNSMGILVQGWKKFVIKPRHIRQAMSISVADARRYLQEIRSVYTRLKGGLNEKCRKKEKAQQGQEREVSARC
jgi:hypothetical protein